MNKKLRLGMVCLLIFCFAVSGCAMFQRQPSYILTEREQYHFIPANTPYKAQLVKNGPLVEIQRTTPAWVVDSAYLANLQESANAAILELPDR